MALHGPIVIIEDDPNDLEIITAALKDLGVENEPRSFRKAEEGMTYLLQTAEQPFIILCDIRMSQLNGLAFRKGIMANDFLRRKSIPFVFFTAAVSADIVSEAYDLQVQGFYEKAALYADLKEQLRAIVVYWKHCLHPNSELKR